jgi:hypothetical protein
VSKLKLPPNPKGIRVLKTVESDRLKKDFPDPKRLPPSYKQCITCKGTHEFNWYDQNQVNEDSFGVATYECDCVGQWVLHRYFLYNGIGVNLQRVGWLNCIADGSARRIVQSYLMDSNLDWNVEQGTGLFLYGPRGTGKSLMASLFLRRTLSLGYSGHWTSFIQMREAKTNEWDDEEKTEWFNRKIRGTSVLVIDDPGQEHKSEKSIEFSRTVLDDVIRHRMSASLPTVITSNKTPDEFRMLYGGNVDSLIQERMIPVSVPGADYRPQMRPDAERERSLGLTRPIVIA